MRKKYLLLCILTVCIICFNSIASSAVFGGDAVVAIPERGIDENNVFMKTKDPVDEYAYSFAVLGDLQRLNYTFSDQFHIPFDWLIANKDEKKIQFVFTLGDITDGSNAAEYLRVSQQHERLNGILPYSIVRGNHDSIETFDRFISYDKFSSIIDESYDGTMKNTYKTFAVGDIKYLVLNLDLIASDDELKWAGEVCDKFPDHNVIVTTHIYMYNTGIRYSIIHTKKYNCENDGEDMWNKLLSKHKNIVLVLCGHSMSDIIGLRESKGDYGNRVMQMMVDPSVADANWGGCGLVAMLYFSEDGRNVQVEYYSTIKDSYFVPVNQFRFTMDVVKSTQDVGNAAAAVETDGSETSAATTQPKTSDAVNIPMLIATILICGACIAGTTIYIRKKTR